MRPVVVAHLVTGAWTSKDSGEARLPVINPTSIAVHPASEASRSSTGVKSGSSPPPPRAPLPRGR